MYFPISGVVVNPIFLAGVGFLVGILGGFFGVGGGFLAGPLMFLTGVPMNYVVGTDLAHMTGKSVVAARRHRVLGHVDVRLGVIMIGGTVFGVEAGAQIIERLKHIGQVENVIGWAYVVILLLIGTFTFIESSRALRGKTSGEHNPETGDQPAMNAFALRIQKLRLWPMLSFPNSGIESISLWSVLVVGFLTGLLAGALGVGGGFIRMPMLVYGLGIPTHVAIGTDLFEIIFSAGYGTLTHAVKGNVDILMALVMQTGAAVGAQIGATSTRFFSGPRIRLLFSLLPFVGAVLVILRLFGIVSGAGH